MVVTQERKTYFIDCRLYMPRALGEMEEHNITSNTYTSKAVCYLFIAEEKNGAS